MLIRDKITSQEAREEATEDSPKRARKPAPEPVIPANLPETVECRGLKICPNDNFLYAVVDGEKIVVRAGKRWAHRLAGKTFEARIVRDDPQTQYVYSP